MINRKGFTLVELVVVIAVIGILATVVGLRYVSIQERSRDSERGANAIAISEALEKYYDNNGEYPGCPAVTADASTVRTNTLKGIDESVFLTPNADTSTTNVIKCVDLTSTSQDDFFSYTGDESDECKTGLTCKQWTLKYQNEESGTISEIQSRRVATALAVADPTDVSLTASLFSTSARGKGSASCSGAGTLEQQIRNRVTNTPSIGAWSAWTTTSQQDVPANQGYQYTFEYRARCNVSLSSSNWVSSGIKNIVRPIASAPAAITVSVSPGNPTLAFSRTSTACPAGTTARYQYKYLADWGYEAGWYGPTTAASFNWSAASEGYEYQMQMQANCYTIYSTSPWSTTASASYIRPVNTPANGPSNFSHTVSGDRTYRTYNWTAPTCNSGARAELRYNSYIGSSAMYWTATGQPGWLYPNGTPGDQGYWSSTYSSTMTTGTVPSGVPVQHRVQYICVNPTTGRSSAWGPVVTSQMFNT